MQGIISLVEASSSTLRVLEYSPLSADGFDHPDPDPNPTSDQLAYSSRPQPHYCQILLSCPHLTYLSISIPSICPALFSSPDIVHWAGDLQVRAARICGSPRDALSSEKAIATFKRILQSARDLIEHRSSSSSSTATRNGNNNDNDNTTCHGRNPHTHRALDIELFIGPYIFTPSTGLVHGDFDLARALSDFTWPAPDVSSTNGWGSDHLALMPSSKGPYGQTGLYGKDLDPDPELGISRQRSWSCVSETAFFDGVARGYVRF